MSELQARIARLEGGALHDRWPRHSAWRQSAGFSKDMRLTIGSAWLRPWIAPLAIMVAAAAGALSGRVFRLSGGIMPPPRSGWWRVVERRALEKTGGIVGVRPCGW